MNRVSRRGFIAAAPAVCATGGVLGLRGRAVAATPASAGLGSFPRQDDEAVKEIVGVSHRDVGRVRELVTARPALAKASWDWGFGDWETALGAASHTGQQAIAEVLIEHGARPDIFTFAMLGDLPSVRAMIEAQPGVQRIPGPHGIPLLAHAKAGGERAGAVAAYLEGLGDAGITDVSLPLTEEERAAYLGTYRVDGDGDVTFEIKEQRGMVAFQKPGEFFRGLFNLGNHEFHPVGAKAVRLRFEMSEGRAALATISDGALVVSARRTA